MTVSKIGRATSVIPLSEQCCEHNFDYCHCEQTLCERNCVSNDRE